VFDLALRTKPTSEAPYHVALSEIEEAEGVDAGVVRQGIFTP